MRAHACGLALLASCVAARQLPSQSLDISQYAHTAWRVRDGFTKGEITSITQTPDGYLWLGTRFGLLRFDGVRATPWQPPAGQKLPSEIIDALLVSRDSTLWIATWNGLASFKAGMLTSYPATLGAPSTGLRETRDGTIWVGRSLPGDVCAVHRAQVACDGRGRLGTLTAELVEDADGNLWVASNTGVWRWSPGVPQQFFRYHSVADIDAITQSEEGTLVIATSQGFRTIKGGRIRDYSIAGIDPGMRPRSIHRTNDGALWIAGRQGLYHVHDGRVDSFGLADGLSGSVVIDIHEDREGNVWVATTGGIDRFRPVAIPSLGVKEGLASEQAFSVQAERDGSVWIVASGALHRWRAGLLERVKGERPSGSLGRDDQGRVWAATERGAEFFDGSRFRLGVAESGREILALAGDGRGGVWLLGGYFGLARSTGSGVVRRFPQPSTTHVIATLLPDTIAGGVWLGYFDGGMSYLAPDGRMTLSYAARDGLAPGRILQLRRAADGAIWTATEGGLSRVNGSQIATLTSRNGLPCDVVHWSMEDNDGSLWLYMPCGLIRIVRAEVDAWERDEKHVVKVTSFDADDGVLVVKQFGSYSPRVTKAPDGRIWFVSQVGVSVIDPRHLTRNQVPPPVHIEQIVADGKAYDVAELTSGRLRLPPHVRNLAIDYTALSLAIPEKVRFRFKLEGQDTRWREVVNQRHVEYSNLAPGGYTFRLTAANDNGVWSDQGTSLAFTVPPAFYQANWFRVLVAGGVLALLWGAYRYRIGRLHLREAQFQETIEAMPALAYIALPNGDRTFFNRRWMEYTGMARAHAVGAGWLDAVHPDDRENVRAHWRNAIATGTALEYELRLCGANGEHRWFFTRAVPVKDKRGHVTKWYGITTDIEERKRAEQERERYRQIEAELAHINRVSTMGELTASLAHEIRQPVASTVMNANLTLRLLEREEPNLEKARDATKRILKDGARVDEIISRVRSLYKKAPPHRERADMNEIIREVSALLQSETSRHSISLRLDLAPDLPSIIGDRIQLQQVFMNLVLNGIEAMKDKPGGVLTISSCVDHQHDLSFMVRDTGVGLPAGKGDDIFLPFFTTKPQGSGMGLAICRSIVESHGGQLRALPNDEGGATFHVVLPARVKDGDGSVAYSARVLS